MKKIQIVPDVLRADAESYVSQTMPMFPNMLHQELIHELQVHQIELEMQNEALRESHVALEASRDRYFSLYEFSTVSFITLSQSGQIQEINLTGTALLGGDRKKLIQRRFDNFIAPDSQSNWHLYYLKVIKSDTKQSCELFMHRLNGTKFHAYLIGHQIKLVDGQSGLHITLVDNTEEKQREAAKRHLESLLSTLTRRERDVLKLALEGLQNKEISLHLNFHSRTVENHRARIHSKTGIDSLLKLSRMISNSGITLKDIGLTAKIPK